jgi:hypothetical protein
VRSRLSVAARTLQVVVSVCCLGERAAKGVAQKRSPSQDSPGARAASKPPPPRELRHSARSLPATPADTLLEFGLAALRPVTLMQVATSCALQRLVPTAPSSRCRPTALPLLPLTHGASPSGWFTSCQGLQRLARSGRRAGRAASGVKGCGRTRSVHRERSSECTLSNYPRGCPGAFIGVHWAGQRECAYGGERWWPWAHWTKIRTAS